ncbi:hypothetical protein H2248_004306 [Termitomyces sp. 'cryptogamus']|nr:hypothetical protein H2248_004306 [Termitomyces sp. 'cryptogamus']
MEVPYLAKSPEPIVLLRTDPNVLPYHLEHFVWAADQQKGWLDTWLDVAVHMGLDPRQAQAKGLRETFETADKFAARALVTVATPGTVCCLQLHCLQWPKFSHVIAAILHRFSMLSLPEYERYGRQMILEGFGLPGK